MQTYMYVTATPVEIPSSIFASYNSLSTIGNQEVSLWFSVTRNVTLYEFLVTSNIVVPVVLMTGKQQQQQQHLLNVRWESSIKTTFKETDHVDGSCSG